MLAALTGQGADVVVPDLRGCGEAVDGRPDAVRAYLEHYLRALVRSGLHARPDAA